MVIYKIMNNLILWKYIIVFMLLGGRYDEYYDMFFFVIEIIVEVEVGEGNSLFDLVIKEIRIE